MIKKLVGIVLGVFLLGSCASLQMSWDDPQQVFVKSLARTLGGSFASNNPEDACDVRPFVDTFLNSEENLQVQFFDTGMKYLVEKVGDDPIMQANAKDLLECLGLELLIGSEDGILVMSEEIREAVEAFAEGVDIVVEVQGLCD